MTKNIVIAMSNWKIEYTYIYNKSMLECQYKYKQADTKAYWADPKAYS